MRKKLDSFNNLIMNSYKKFTVIDCNKHKLQKDFFLTIVFCQLYDLTSPNVVFGINRSFKTMEEFKAILLSVKNNNKLSSAIYQVVELIIEQFEFTDFSSFNHKIYDLIFELGAITQQKKITKLEAISLYNDTLRSLSDIHDTKFEPINLSPVFLQILKALDKDIVKKRMYLPFDTETSLSISYFEPNQPINIKYIKQPPKHTLRLLAFLQVSDVRCFNSNFLESDHESLPSSIDLAVKLIKPPRTTSKSETKEKGAQVEAGNKLPRYREFNIINTLIQNLSKNGTGYLFLVQSALNRQVDAESRAQLVKGKCISAVVLLPQKLFTQQTFELVLIILKKNSKFVRFIDAVDFYSVSDKKHSLTRLNELENLINSKEEISGRSFHVPIDIIIKNNSSLHPVAYKDLFWLENIGVKELESQRLSLLNELELAQDNIGKLVNNFIT